MLDKDKMASIASKEYKLLFAAQRLNAARRIFDSYLKSFDVFLMETPTFEVDRTLPDITEFYAKRENILVLRKERDLLENLMLSLNLELECYEDFLNERSAVRRKYEE